MWAISYLRGTEKNLSNNKTNNTTEETTKQCCNGEYCPITETKQLRKDLDAQLQVLKPSPRKSRERSLAITKIEEGIMWLGMDLKDQVTPNPYPQSYNPESKDIEPTADGLKL